MSHAGRRYINEVLLTAGENFPNLHYHFEHKLTEIDLENADLTFQCPGENDPVQAREIVIYFALFDYYIRLRFFEQF